MPRTIINQEARILLSATYLTEEQQERFSSELKEAFAQFGNEVNFSKLCVILPTLGNPAWAFLTDLGFGPHSKPGQTLTQFLKYSI